MKEGPHSDSRASVSLASSLRAGALELELPSAVVCSDHRKLGVKGVAFTAASFSHTLATFFSGWCRSLIGSSSGGWGGWHSCGEGKPEQQVSCLLLWGGAIEEPVPSPVNLVHSIYQGNQECSLEIRTLSSTSFRK